MADSWGAADTSSTEFTNGGFETSHDGFASTEGDGLQEEAGRIQEDKVNKKRLAELGDDGKMIQIFVRPTKDSGLIPYAAAKGLPLNVATICSNLFFEHFNKKRRDYYIIQDSNLAPYNFVFDWMKHCGEEKGVANLPEIKDMAEPETGLKPFIDIMLVAAKLKIPTASFNKFMLKKMTFMARDYLIDLPTVSRIFDSGDVDMYELGLQEVAAISIFSHWYDYKLDAAGFDDYMCELTDMRGNIQELDEALHKAVEDKDAWLKNKRQERREKQASEEAGAGWGAAGDNADAGAVENPSFGGGDAWVKQGKTATNDWDKPDAIAGCTPAWATKNGAAAAGGDWADEMNDNLRPVLAITAGDGW